MAGSRSSGPEVQLELCEGDRPDMKMNLAEFHEVIESMGVLVDGFPPRDDAPLGTPGTVRNHIRMFP